MVYATEHNKKGKQNFLYAANPSKNRVTIPKGRDIKYRRDFGGKRKLVFLDITNKAEAESTAKFRRKQGLKARVVKTKAGYVLYG